MTRGEIYRVAARCYVVVSRRTLIESRADRVVCAPVNSSFVGLDTQVPVGVPEGLKHDSCINCDQLVLLEKSRLTNYVGSLMPPRLMELRRALRVALDVD